MRYAQIRLPGWWWCECGGGDVEWMRVGRAEAIEIGPVVLTLSTPDLYGTCN